MQQQFVLMDMDPAACPKRRRQDCVSDLAACWRDSDMHLYALAGWKANMITNALDGSENNLGSSEMQGYWMELGMDEVRARTIDEVCSSAEAGRLEWAYEVVYGLLDSFPKRGVLDVLEDGQSEDGEDDENAAAWRDDQALSGEGETARKTQRCAATLRACERWTPWLRQPTVTPAC